GRARVVGEFKTPWTTDLSEPRSKDTRKVLGQVARYMAHYTCTYGFVSTYEESIFAKR
ncbi:hypothetical protein BO71DRAFT_298443, partial [Aspergillus ellipticus CBS 707.79]